MINTDGSVATSSVDRRAREFMTASNEDPKACLASFGSELWMDLLDPTQNKINDANDLCVDTRRLVWPYANDRVNCDAPNSLWPTYDVCLTYCNTVLRANATCHSSTRTSLVALTATCDFPIRGGKACCAFDRTHRRR